MKKRIIAVGTAAALAAFGAGSAVAVGDISQTDQTTQANGVLQGNWQENSPWQTSIQDNPNAQAGATADTGVGIGAGGDSIGSSGSGNGFVFAGTSGGIASAAADNTIDVDQGKLSNASGQAVFQGNGNLTFKLNISGSNFGDD